jgi:pimeloyl-ACP methyl ester carboxylesterase
MSRRSTAQAWVVDTLLAGTGYEVLHPESRHFLAEIGYDPVDFNRVLSRVKASAMMPKAWREVAVELERKAHWYEAEGFPGTAQSVYQRACLAWCRARYAFPVDDPRRAGFNAAANRCTEGYIRNGTTRIEPLQVPFEGAVVHAIAHYPTGEGPAPLVLLLPGMDMYKEDWTRVAQEHYLPRGFAVLAVDGPGQGETATGGLGVVGDNYERAIVALIDAMAAKPEIDAERIGLWGVSMGSYWGLRTAAIEPRLKAAATAMGCYGSMDIIFGRAQPGFKANYMRMSGYADEDRFDAEVASQMSVAAVADQIACPVLMSYGEFDELSTLEETRALFAMLGEPKRLVVYEQEFHALGGVGAELIRSAADWLTAALAGDLPADQAAEAYVTKTGVMGETSEPVWWSAGEPAA